MSGQWATLHAWHDGALWAVSIADLTIFNNCVARCHQALWTPILAIFLPDYVTVVQIGIFIPAVLLLMVRATAGVVPIYGSKRFVWGDDTWFYLLDTLPEFLSLVILCWPKLLARSILIIPSFLAKICHLSVSEIGLELCAAIEANSPFRIVGPSCFVPIRNFGTTQSAFSFGHKPPIHSRLGPCIDYRTSDRIWTKILSWGQLWVRSLHANKTNKISRTFEQNNWGCLLTPEICRISCAPRPPSKKDKDVESSWGSHLADKVWLNWKHAHYSD